MLVEDNGKLRNADDVALADKIMDLREKGDPWPVIDELVKVWIKRSPEEEKAMMINVEDHREMLVDKEYGTTLGGKDMDRRFKLLFPQGVEFLIRAVYKSEELPFNKDFYIEFGKRYPGFRVAQKD